jgi:hypothetical protein
MKRKKFNERFNENYTDSNYDYTMWIKPIDFDTVKSYIIEEVKNYIDDSGESLSIESMMSDIEQLAKRKMFSYWNDLNYLGENNEDDIENIVNGDFN